MTDDDLVIIEDHGPVRLFQLNRPGMHNAWSDDMEQALIRAFEEADKDDSVRACAITGKGTEAFCSGMNLKEVDAHQISSVDEHLNSMRAAANPLFFKKLTTFKKPVVCGVNGYAIGAGFLLTICCDIIIAGENADFRLPQANLGIMPAYAGGARLAQWIGRGRALEIALTGRSVGAEEAKAIGLVTQVVPVDEVRPTIMTLARRLADMPAGGVTMTKESLTNALEASSLVATAMTDLYRVLALSMSEETTARHHQWRQDHEAAKAHDRR